MNPSDLVARHVECPDCGQVHRKCKAHNRRGGPCGLDPAKHQRVCHLHGARSPKALQAAERREVEERAAEALARRWQANGVDPVTDPLGELARLAGEVVAFKDYLRDQVQGLNGVLTYWVDRDFYGPDGEVARSEAVENARAIVTVYERAIDRAAKVLADMVKLDLAGRMVAVRTAEADHLETALRAGLNTVDLEVAVRTAILTAVADQLEQMTAPPTFQAPRELMP